MNFIKKNALNFVVGLLVVAGLVMLFRDIDWNRTVPSRSSSTTANAVLETALSAVSARPVKYKPSSPKGGSVCFEVGNEQREEMTGCRFHWRQFAPESQPVLSKWSNTECNGPGEYPFHGFDDGLYDVDVRCGSYTGLKEKLRLEKRRQWYIPVAVFPRVSDGKFCVRQLYHSLWWNKLKIDFSSSIGYGSDDFCAKAKPEALAGMNVVSVEQIYGPGYCLSMTDQNCSIQVSGLSVSVNDNFKKLELFDTRLFKVVVQDANLDEVTIRVSTNAEFLPWDVNR